MNPKDLLPYWPTRENIQACIKPEAETINDAVFLAVHQHMTFKRRTVGGTGATEPTTESDLLNAFMTNDLPEGRMILPIVGNSGVGKSHAICWLEAQLLRRKDAGRLLIIRIPKASSLKRVLLLILNKLPGPQFAKLRETLLQAREALNPERAAGQLRLNLCFELVEEARRAKSLLSKSDLPKSDREHYQKLSTFCGSGDLDKGLPSLLSDPYLQQHHFLSTGKNKGIIAKLAEHVTEESSREEDTRTHQFSTSDLELPDDFIPEMSPQAKAFYIKINKEDGKDRAFAAEVLNQVLDAAKRDLFSLGDTSVPELFADAREELYKQNKELVLLVEDFAVLSGLQRSLMDVMIREAYRGGKQVLCTMRSAIAYTDGYQLAETVKTRARVEWFLEDAPGAEAEIVEKATKLVGSYLNAARLGQSHLEEAFRSRSDTDDIRGWIPSFRADLSDEAEKCLDSFGFTSPGKDKYPLFPLNEMAIQQLVREGSLNSAKTVIFNPRNIINNVIRETLLLRSEFERQEFPTATFGQRGVTAPEVITEVKRTAGDKLQRYLRLLAYWGGSPQTLQEIGSLPAAVYEAFSLKPLSIKNLGPSQPTVKTKPSTTEPSKTDEATVLQEPSDIADFRKTLDLWHRGTLLGQREANELRQNIAKSLLNYVEWDWYHIKLHWTSQLLSKHISIPHAKGQDGLEEIKIQICGDADRVDPVRSAEIRNELLAVYRFYHYKSWDYDGAELDAIYYANLMQRLAPSVVEFVRHSVLLVKANTLRVLAEVLLVGARSLGLEGTNSPHSVDALLRPTESMPKPPSASPWQSVQEKLNLLRGNEKDPRSAILLLLDHIAARQGNAKVVSAIDVAQLLPIIREIRSDWSLKESLPPTSSTEKKSYKEFRAAFQELMVALPQAIDDEKKFLSDWHLRAQSLLGSSLDKDATILEIEETIKAAKKTGLVHDFDDSELRSAVKAFRDAKVKGALDKVLGLQTDNRGAELAILSEGFRSTAEAVDSLDKKFGQFVEVYTKSIQGELDTLGEDPVEHAKQDLVSDLFELKGTLEEAKEIK